MSTSFTLNFLWAKHDTGASNWGATYNAVLNSMDIELKASQSPLVSLLFDQVLISRLNGEIVLQHYQL